MVESEKLETVGCGKMVPVLRRPNFRTKDPTVNAYYSNGDKKSYEKLTYASY